MQINSSYFYLIPLNKMNPPKNRFGSPMVKTWLRPSSKSLYFLTNETKLKIKTFIVLASMFLRHFDALATDAHAFESLRLICVKLLFITGGRRKGGKDHHSSSFESGSLDQQPAPPNAVS